MSQKRVICLFFVCWTVAWGFHVHPASGCGCVGDPPCNPNCSWCASGVWVCQCSAPCEGLPVGWTCVDGCYTSCSTWDPYDPIDGSITVWPETVPICYEWVTFDSDVVDVDRREIGTWWGYPNAIQYPTDTITYLWSTNPAVGQWHPEWGNEFPQAPWQAPPCIGTVAVRLDVDDLPAEAVNACPCEGEDDRDDGAPLPYYGTVYVVLPTGCSQGGGGLEINLNEVSFSGAGCVDGRCGYFHTEPPEGPTDALYNDCSWECLIEINQNYEWGMCDGDFTEISNGDDSDITLANYCALVQGFKYDPSIPSTGCGCLSINGTSYNNHDCGEKHEQAHRDEYIERVGDLWEMIMLSGSLSIPIVCNDPDSPKTCQLADTEECMPLAEEIMNQMGVIYAEVDSPAGEERARAAAQSDYRTLADSICARASKAGWPSCPACSQ